MYVRFEQEVERITVELNQKDDNLLSLVDRLIVAYQEKNGVALSFSRKEAFCLIKHWLDCHLERLLDDELNDGDSLLNFVEYNLATWKKTVF